METIRVPRSSFESIKTLEDIKAVKNKFTNVGFGEKARSYEDNIFLRDNVENMVPANINKVSWCAKWTAAELEKLTKAGATQAQINKMAELLPMRTLMQNALKKRGFPVPPDISDLTTSFYNNVIKQSAVGKYFEHVEGNPILYKMNASTLVISSLVDLVPAATAFVNAAMVKSSEINDPQLVQDAKDIQAFINAKALGLPTDGIGVGKASLSPWLIGGVLIVIAFLLLKH
jgi:hypothetical protein